MDRIIKAGETSRSVLVRLFDPATGREVTGLAWNTPNLTCYYARPGAAAAAVTLATQSVTGTYSSGGFVEIDATHMPGLYRFDPPNAVIAAGATGVVVQFANSSTGLSYGTFDADLWALDPQNFDKTGYKLASDGFDSVSTACGSGIATNAREALNQIYRRFFGKVAKTSSQLRHYDASSQLVMTQDYSSSAGVETVEAAE